MVEILFWILVVLIGYVYAGYPLILCFFSHLLPQPVAAGGDRPSVSVIIPAHNEEEVIGEKIRSILDCGYPRELLEVIVASDASTDRTDRRAAEFQAAGIKLIRFPERVGKTEMINRVVPQSSGRIVLISDADTRTEPGSIPELVSHFAIRDIGAVCGKRAVADHLTGAAAIADGLYCRYESFIKKHEGLLLSIMGADGSLYGFRRELFSKVPPNVPDDFAVVLQILRKKEGVIYAARAVSREQVFTTLFREFKRKQRTIARGIRGVVWARDLLNPFRYPLPAFQLISHKIIRWLIPFFLLLLFGLNLALLDKLFYRFTLLAQIIFYATAAAGIWLGAIDKKNKLFLVPSYFCLMNAASVAGIWMWLRGIDRPYWDNPKGNG